MEIEDDRKSDKIKNKDWGEYREKTKQELPKKPLVKLLDYLEPGKAIELGPGSGTDTLYMLEKGWEVLGIDSDKGTENDIRTRIKVSDKLLNLNEKFSFRNQQFENLELEKECCNLLVGFNSLFFCSPEHFQEFFKIITDAIKPGGYLLVNLLGKNDDWNKIENSGKTFLSKEEILDLLKDFEIGENGIKEGEFEKETAISKIPKHWHTFLVRARKK